MVEEQHPAPDTYTRIPYGNTVYFARTHSDTACSYCHRHSGAAYAHCHPGGADSHTHTTHRHEHSGSAYSNPAPVHPPMGEHHD